MAVVDRSSQLLVDKPLVNQRVRNRNHLAATSRIPDKLLAENSSVREQQLSLILLLRRHYTGSRWILENDQPHGVTWLGKALQDRRVHIKGDRHHRQARSIVDPSGIPRQHVLSDARGVKRYDGRRGNRTRR